MIIAAIFPRLTAYALFAGFIIAGLLGWDWDDRLVVGSDHDNAGAA